MEFNTEVGMVGATNQRANRTSGGGVEQVIYLWLWRKLPGNKLSKAVQTLLLAILVIGILVVFVYPNVSLFLESDPTLAG